MVSKLSNRKTSMAADSDGIGTPTTVVVICEGNLHDPDFQKKFRTLLGKLKNILQQPKSKKLKVNKIEPWNSVRVTLKIPKEAAQRLRQLASEGSSALRALGILSVQLEGDTVISLRLVGQEIVLRTDNNSDGYSREAGSSSSSGTSSINDLTRILASPLQTASGSCSTVPRTNITSNKINVEPIPGPSHAVLPPALAAQTQSVQSSTIANNRQPTTPFVSLDGFEKTPIFKSPNTVCPMDGKLPMPPLTTSSSENREYPFESMTQARVIQRRENTMAGLAALNQNQIPPGNRNSPQVVVMNQLVGLSQNSSQTTAGSSALMNKGQNCGNQEQTLVKNQFLQPQPPPPPYPTVSNTQLNKQMHPQSSINPNFNNSNNIAISSPLLVNLLQNDGPSNTIKSQISSTSKIAQHQQSVQHLVAKTSPHRILETSTSGLNSTLHTASINQATDSNNTLLHHPNHLIVNSSVHNNGHKSNLIGVNSPVTPVPSQALINTMRNNSQPSSNITLNSNITHAASNNFGSNQNGNVLIQQSNEMHLNPQQQIRFQPQQQVLIRHPRQIPVGGSNVVLPLQPRFVPNQQLNVAQQQLANQQHRHIVSQRSPLQQQFITPPQSPHPNVNQINTPTAVLSSSTSSLRTTTPINLLQQNHHQQQEQQADDSNHSRDSPWNLKPMDSATKSSFQEFARYQMQYNLQQQQISQQQGGTTSLQQTPTNAIIKQQTTNNINKVDGFNVLPDLDELTKNDLDALLPSLNCDLDSALSLEDKNALESLLQDAKDLDLDLIDPSLSSVTPNMLEATLGCMDNIENNDMLVGSRINQIPSRNLLDSESLSNKDLQPSNNNVSMISEYSTNVVGATTKQLLINPLTGELEPMPSEESDVETDNTSNQKLSGTNSFQDFNIDGTTNSLFSDDENSCSTAFSKLSDHSDTERSRDSENSNRSRYSKNSKKTKKEIVNLTGSANLIDTSGNSNNNNNMGINTAKKSKYSMKNTLLREKLQQGIKEKSRAKQPKDKKIKISANPNTKGSMLVAGSIISDTIPTGGNSPTEKIKLRLKLEKSEPVTPAYKVDVSFVQSPKRAQTTSSNDSNQSGVGGATYTTSASISAGAKVSVLSINSQQSDVIALQQSGSPTSQANSEALRVPPLHISLRGKNSVVIRNSKKDRKKSQSGGEEDESSGVKKNSLKRNYNISEDNNAHLISNKSGSNMISSQSNDDLNTAGKSPIHSKSKQNVDDNQNRSYRSSSLTVTNGGDVNIKQNDGINYTNLNGISDIKKRRLSQSCEQQQQSNILHKPLSPQLESCSSKEFLDPIGSTNIGTLLQPQSKVNNFSNNNNNNNNNSSIYSTTTKNSFKSTIGGKPIVKSHNVILSNQSKEPDKKVSINQTINLTLEKSSESKSDILTKQITENASLNLINSSIKAITSVALILPQGSLSSISAEVFKQKLMEPSTKTTSINEIKKSLFQSSREILNKIEVQKSERNTSNDVKTSTSGTEPSLNSAIGQIVNQQEIKITPDSIQKVKPSCSTQEEQKHSIPTKPESKVSVTDSNIKHENGTNRQQLQKIDRQNDISLPKQHEMDITQIARLPNTISNSIVRNSPGSQAQGEDSGIESMDALSEKSPHQTTSPMQVELISQQQSKLCTENQRVQASREVIISDNEVKVTTSKNAMIKNEVSNHTIKQQKEVNNELTEISSLNDIEAALAKMEGINEDFLVPSESLEQYSKKYNGEHSMTDDLIKNLTDDKVVLTTTNISSNSIICDSKSKTNILQHDLNKNKDLNLKNDLSKGCSDIKPIPKLFKSIKSESNLDKNTSALLQPDQNVDCIKTAIVDLSKDIILTNNIKTEINDQQTLINDSDIKMETENETKREKTESETFSCKSKGSNCNELMEPISIEIPAQVDTEVPRIRTRASSKLESPLEILKSPHQDTPSNTTKTNCKVLINAYDHLSPKQAAFGKVVTGLNTTSIVNVKRKRQGSESSIESSPNQDIKTGTAISPSEQKNNVKRARTGSFSISSSTSVNTETINCTQIKCLNSRKSSPSTILLIENNKGACQQKSNKKNDESSDSDEPLIEIAGKVRCSKTPSSKVLSPEIHIDKVLRNSRVLVSQSKTPSPVTTGTNTSALSTNPILKVSKSSISPNPVQTSMSIPSIPNNIHVTRGVSIQSNNLSTTDEKIGTRRSVRASAAANKIIYSKGTHTIENKNTPTKPGNIDGAEARRKTRSAVTGDTPTPEGRRRRGSRDSK